MLTSLAVESFRVFCRFELPDLSRVNLIGGVNNVGKTALLEAILLLASDGNPSCVYNLLSFRGLGRITGTPHEKAEWIWHSLFHEFRIDQCIELSAHVTDVGPVSVTLRLRPRGDPTVLDETPSDRMDLNSGGNGASAFELVLDYRTAAGLAPERIMCVAPNGEVRTQPAALTPRLPGYFLAARSPISHEENARLFSSLRIQKTEFDLVPILRLLEPRLSRIEAFTGVGGMILYGDVGLGRMLPLGMLGDGLTHLTSILLRIATAPHGYLMIDEIENGFHHSVMPAVWRAIAEAAEKSDTQVFATTHSLECIRAANEIYASRPTYDFRYQRLERTAAGVIEAVPYRPGVMMAAIDRDVEVR